MKENVKANEPSIYLSVQFYTSESELEPDNKKFLGLENVSSYKYGTQFKYVSGKFTDPNDVINHQTKVRNAGFKDAFVVAFKNGQRIDYKLAVSQLNK